MKFKRFIRNILNMFLIGNSQIVLFLLAVIGLAVLRVIIGGSGVIPTSDLGFSIEHLDCSGVVVYSDEQNRLIIDQGKLLLYRADEEDMLLLASEIVNLYSVDKQIWVKTKRDVQFLDLSLVQLELLADQDETLAGARLVGIGDYGMDFFHNGQVLVRTEAGWDHGPYVYSGSSSRQPMEGEWRSGVLFFTNSGWTVYSQHLPRTVYALPLGQGLLVDAYLAPDRSRVVYAVVNGDRTEVLVANVNGSDARVLYTEQMIFSDLEVVWSSDSRQAVFSILGFDSEDEEFITATLIYQPGSMSVDLHHYRGDRVDALVPSAWGSDGRRIYLNNYSEEIARPIMYSLFRPE